MFSIMYCFNITLKGFSIPISVSTVQGIPPTTTLTWPLKDPRTWALHVHCFTFYEASLSITTGKDKKSLLELIFLRAYSVFSIQYSISFQSERPLWYYVWIIYKYLINVCVTKNMFTRSDKRYCIIYIELFSHNTSWIQYLKF